MSQENSESEIETEFETIDRYFRQAGLAFSKPGVALGIGDDCALFSVPSGQQLAVSMDVLLEDVHFPSSADPEKIARRALAVNLSDLAAMGAEPLGFTLGLSIPSTDKQWLTGFSTGLLSSAREYDCPLVGGDLCQGPLSITIQVHGLVTQGEAINRSGAKVGDQIFVSGSLGDAAIALLLMNIDSPISKSVRMNHEALTDDYRSHFFSAFFDPVPRLELARSARHLINCGIDISDGLLGDLGHILKASAVGARINTEELPLSEAMKQSVDANGQIVAALSGGDDYELCLTLAPENSAKFCHIAEDLGVSVSCIGEIVDRPAQTESPALQILDAQGEQVELMVHSYRHFGQGDD